MKRQTFICINFFLIFSLQSWTKADDISDFEIEGFSIGDSALDHFSINEIENPGEENIYYYPKSKKFYEQVMTSKKSEIYDEIQISLKNNDKKYIIYNVNGTKYFNRDIDKCEKQKKIIEKEISNLFKIKKETEKGKHNADKTGKSPYNASWYIFPSEDHIGIICANFHEDTDLEVSLKVLITSQEYNNFLLNEAY